MKKKLTSAISILMALMLVGGLIAPYTVTYAAISDTNAPTINSITFLPTEVVAPTKLDIVVDVTDDISGVNYVEVWFKKGTDNTLCISKSGFNNSNDGKWHLETDITKYMTGTYVLDRIDCKDNAGNTTSYASYLNGFPENLQNISFSIVNNFEIDTEPPVVNDISLSANTINAPGNIGITLNISDNISGVKYASINFKDYEHDKLMVFFLNKNDEDGLWHGSWSANEFIEGIYKIYSISCTDDAGNSLNVAEYMNNIPEQFKSIQFEVTNSQKRDITAPVINSVIITPTDVNVPGTIDIAVAAIDDLSGVSSITLWFDNTETNSQTCIMYTGAKLSSDGKYHISSELNQYMYGTNKLTRIDCTDDANNTVSYASYMNTLPDRLKNVYYKAINDGTTDTITSSLDNPRLEDEIRATSDDAIIKVDFTNSINEVPSNVFSAIAGTQKTLKLEAEGIQWQFFGSSLSSSVSIKPQVFINKAESLTDPVEKAAIEALTNNAPTVVLDFEHSGTLPGKALIRVKADYAMKQYIGTEGMAVYYYDKVNNRLEEVANNLTIRTDSTGDYIEFYIDHCSTYLIKGKKAAPLPPAPAPSDSIDNWSSWFPMYDSSILLASDNSSSNSSAATVESSMVISDNMSNVPTGATLSCSQIKTNSSGYKYALSVVERLIDTNRAYVYDIKLNKNGSKVQPNGTIAITCNLPDGLDSSKIVVYRINDDNTYTKLKSSVKNGKVTFETNHFSYYIIAEEGQGNKAEAPKTGISFLGL